MAGRGDIEAGKSFIRLFLKNDLTKQLSGALNNMGNQLRGVGTQVAKIGAGVAAAGAAISAPIAGAVKHFAAFGDQLDKMSLRTGVAAPALAELGFAAEQSGTDLDTVEKSIRRMQKTIGDAGRGLSTATEAFHSLGLSAAGLEGMAPEDQFQLIADRIKGITDPTKRAAAAMEVFGSRTGTAIIPMLEGLSDLRQEARDLGIVPTEEQVKNAAKVTDAINRIRRAVGAVAFEIGASLADEVLAFASAAKHVVVSVRDWVKENVGLVKTIAALGVLLIGAGAALVALGGGIFGLGVVFSGLATGITFIGSAIGLLFSPLGLIVTALTAGTVLWAKYTDAGKTAIAGLKDTLGTLRDVAKKTFGGIADALRGGDLKLAGKIAFTGLQLAAAQALNGLRKLVGDTIVSIIGKLASGDLSGAWADALAQMSLLWATWSEGVVGVITSMADSVVGVWEKVVNFIADKILELASLPGFNKLFEFVSGVDLRAEIERGKRLGTEDPLGEAKAVAHEQTRARAQAMLDALEEVRQTAAARTRERAEAAVAETSEGIGGLEDFIATLQEELRSLSIEASDKADEARKDTKESAAAEGDGSAAGGIGGRNLSSLVTFSAAAAEAIGFREAPEKKMARDMERTRKAVERDLEFAKETVKAVTGMAAAFKDLAATFAYR